MLLGLVAPEGRARIFILYSLPMNPVTAASLDTEPPQALLARLGVRRNEASGFLEDGFLSSPRLAAIHWTLVGPGDGTTFSMEAEPGEETYSLRTILSFVLVESNGERTPVVLTAFLRCRPAAAESLRPKFHALLRSLAPSHATSRILAPEVAAQEATRQAFSEALTAAAKLLERELLSLASGRRPALSSEDRATIQAVLKRWPSDPVALLLLGPGSESESAGAKEEATSEAVAAYRRQALLVAKRLEAQLWLQEWYTDPETPARPPAE